MIFSYVSQVNIHTGKTGSLGMVLTENECASSQQKQNRWNDKKQFFQRRFLHFIICPKSGRKIGLTVRRISQSDT